MKGPLLPLEKYIPCFKCCLLSNKHYQHFRTITETKHNFVLERFLKYLSPVGSFSSFSFLYIYEVHVLGCCVLGWGSWKIEQLLLQPTWIIHNRTINQMFSQSHFLRAIHINTFIWPFWILGIQFTWQHLPLIPFDLILSDPMNYILFSFLCVLRYCYLKRFRVFHWEKVTFFR